MRKKNVERTLIFIKPHAIKDGNLYSIRRAIRDSGIDVLRQKFCSLTKEGVEYHYRQLKDKPFFAELVEHFYGELIYVMVLEGENVIENFRELIGPTNPEKCASNQLRGIYGKDIQDNALHASDSPESYESEMEFFFSNNPMVKPMDPNFPYQGL